MRLTLTLSLFHNGVVVDADLIIFISQTNLVIATIAINIFFTTDEHKIQK